MLQTDLSRLGVAFLLYDQLAVLGIDFYGELVARFEQKVTFDVVLAVVAAGIEVAVGGTDEKAVVLGGFWVERGVL